MDDVEESDELGQATGLGSKADGLQLNRLVQLSGLSDPVYVEAYVTVWRGVFLHLPLLTRTLSPPLQVHQYDILLDVTVINQTPDTLTNLTLELATMGDLRLCERPRDYTVAPFDSTKIKANIKVLITSLSLSLSCKGKYLFIYLSKNRFPRQRMESYLVTWCTTSQDRHPPLLPTTTWWYSTRST